jgi:hypothetical protein
VTRSSRSALKDLRWGVFWGFALALGFTAFAAIPAAIRALGPQDDWTAGLSFGELTMFYLGAGLLGGALVGLLRPFAQRWWGRRLLGIIVGLPVFFGGTAMVLDLSEWNRFMWVWMGIGGLIWAQVMSFVFEERSDSRRPTQRMRRWRGR